MNLQESAVVFERLGGINDYFDGKCTILCQAKRISEKNILRCDLYHKIAYLSGFAPPVSSRILSFV